MRLRWEAAASSIQNDPNYFGSNWIYRLPMTQKGFDFEEFGEIFFD